MLRALSTTIRHTHRSQHLLHRWLTYIERPTETADCRGPYAVVRAFGHLELWTKMDPKKKRKRKKRTTIRTVRGIYADGG
ncbi:hypothetical protein K503DRAFT_219222 [Rhizopogon vinicolor AM-OR11-026]|uniref:Uncharacterized protein n=1 Tax=Rhizopogon vinicolor AM-OR11-026 TaxID=1314800 RepID=A0A1B7MYH5_9AGAM|nr:hypothetical protein K503DRAFT_219222 [Rhizopogon vinicolor AM-OR11-026]